MKVQLKQIVLQKKEEEYFCLLRKEKLKTLGLWWPIQAT